MISSIRLQIIDFRSWDIYLLVVILFREMRNVPVVDNIRIFILPV